MNYAERTVALASTLEADGYHMAIEGDEARVSVVITASPEACEDCLAPPDVMRAILGKSLAVPADAIELHYPE